MAGGVKRSAVQTAWHKTCRDRQSTERDLKCARCPKRMTRGPLGGTAGHLGAEDGFDGLALGVVVGECAGTMQIDVINGRGRKPGVVQSGLHRCPRASPLRMRGGDMV